MTFTYQYRTKSGALDSGTIEAANRAECVAKLKAQGIAPNHIAEGKVNRAHATTRRKKAHGGLKLGVVGILLVGLVFGAYLVFVQEKQEGDATDETGKTQKGREAPVQETATNRVVAKRSPLKAKEKVVLPEEPETPWVNIYTNRRGEEVRVDRDGTEVVMFKAWQEKREALKKNPPKRIFKHTGESYMAMFLEPGISVPPPPQNYSSDDVAEMLATKIEIDEEHDTADEIRQKQGVIAMKEQLKEFIEAGGTFNQYLLKLRRRQDMESAKLAEARKIINDEITKGDMKAAKELYDAINKHFDSENMPHVNIAPKYRRMFEGEKKDVKTTVK